MTSLEQLSVVSGEYARSKVYEKNQKKVLGTYLVWFGIEGHANIAQFWLIIFLCEKSAESVDFFIEDYKKGKLTFMTYFDNFDF